MVLFFFSSRRRHTRYWRDWSSDVCSSDLGMTCASCVGRVERALEKVPGVLEANVNLANERATVGYVAGQVEPQDLRKAVDSAGYGVVRGEESSVEDAREREYKKLGDRKST